MSESVPTAADEASRPYDATFASSSTLDMSIDEQLGKAEGFKGEGNQAYERDQLTEALGKWHMSLLHCAGINSFASMYGARSTEAENERAAGITSAVYNNMAACYLKQAKWDKAVYASSKALALAPKNLKALYRRAEAYLELGRNQLAARDIDLALDLRPEGKRIQVSFLGCNTALTTGFLLEPSRSGYSQIGRASSGSLRGRRAQERDGQDRRSMIGVSYVATLLQSPAAILFAPDAIEVWRWPPAKDAGTSPKITGRPANGERRCLVACRGREISSDAQLDVQRTSTAPHASDLHVCTRTLAPTISSHRSVRFSSKSH